MDSLRLCCILLLCMAPATVHSQEPWQLDSCINYALVHNLELRSHDLETSDLKAQLTRSTLDLLPSVNASILTDFNWGRSVDMQELTINRDKLTRATGLSLEASWAVFGGFSRQYARMAAREAVREAEADAQRLREELALDVTRSYLQLLLARQMLNYALENQSTIVRQCERTRSLVEAGSHPQSALSEMEAQVAAESATVVEARCNVRSAVLSLTQLMNLPPGGPPFEVGEAFDDEVSVPDTGQMTDTLIESLAQRDPRIRSARAGILRMQHLSSSARGALLPGVSVTAGYGTYCSTTSDEKAGKQFDENRNPSLSVGVTIPIFNHGETATRIRRSRISLQRARLAHEQMQTRISQEIRSAVIEADNCYQKYLSAEEMLKATGAALRVTEAKYDLGASTALDYIVARNNHSRAQSDLLQAKWQYLFQLRLLEHYKR